MANKNLDDDGEFWLPPEFLTDDDILMDMNIINVADDKEGFDLETRATKSLFPYGFGAFGHSFSDLSSPVESVVGSTETDSDEEDYIAGLTRQIAHSTLEDDAFATKARFVSGSPQSTLCTTGIDSGRGSRNCQSHVSSPPGAWDLLSVAAGEVARMKGNEESYGYQRSRALLGTSRKPFRIADPLKNRYPNLVDAADSIFPHQQFRAPQFQQLKQQQQMMNQQSSSLWGGPQTQRSTQNRLHQVAGMSRVMRNTKTSSGRPLGLSPSAWPPLQHAATKQNQQTQIKQNGSGMHAVFHGPEATKRECAGTGVFLPRQVNTTTEPRKKSACSTVLLPAKVMHALNLMNFDDGGTPFYHRFGSYNLENDAEALRLQNYNNNNNGVSYQKRNHRPQYQQQAMNHEIGLPQEWTY